MTAPVEEGGRALANPDEKELAGPNEEQRAFAKRLLRECTSLRYYGYDGADIEHDDEDAVLEIAARDAALLAEALRPFEGIIDEFKREGRERPTREALCYAHAVNRIAAAIEQARKAGSDGGGRG